MSEKPKNTTKFTMYCIHKCKCNQDEIYATQILLCLSKVAMISQLTFHIYFGFQLHKLKLDSRWKFQFTTGISREERVDM